MIKIKTVSSFDEGRYAANSEPSAERQGWCAVRN